MVKPDRPTRDKAVASLRNISQWTTKTRGPRTPQAMERLILLHVDERSAAATAETSQGSRGLGRRLAREQCLAFSYCFLEDNGEGMDEYRCASVCCAHASPRQNLLTQRHRMDKFLLLTRSYLAATFQHLAKLSWAPEHISRHMHLLSSTPLAPQWTASFQNGLRYHVIDIYVDELDKADRPRNGRTPIESLIEPLQKLKDESPTKPVRMRVEEALGDSRISVWNQEQTENEDAESMDEDGT